MSVEVHIFTSHCRGNSTAYTSVEHPGGHFTWGDIFPTPSRNSPFGALLYMTHSDWSPKGILTIVTTAAGHLDPVY